MKLGIRVDAKQGKINWDKVKKAGCQFAVLRCIGPDGKQDDKVWSHVQECVKHKISFEFYISAMAEDDDGLLLEMEHAAVFIKELKNRYGEIETTVWWDIEHLEDPPPMPMEVDNQELTNLIRMAQTGITGTGLGFGLCVPKSFLTAEYFYPEQLDCPFCVISYPSAQEIVFGKDFPPEEKRPLPVPPLLMWEYTKSGKVKGITGAVKLCEKYEWEEVAV